MIRQLLLFKFKKKITRDKIKLFFDKWKALESLNCVDSIEFGKNTSTEGFDKGFQFGGIASFKNKESVKEFLKHPDHLKLVDELLNPILDDFVLVEYKK